MLKEPQDIYSATYALLLVNRILGTAPYVLTKPPDRKYEICRIYIAVGFFKISLILALMIYCMIQIKDVGFIGNLKFSSDVFVCALSSIFIAFSIFRAKYIILAFNILVKVDKQFRTLGIWMSYQQIRKQIFIHLLCLFISTVILISLDVVLQNKSSFFDLSYMCSYIPQFLIISVEIQYYNYLHLAMCRYKILNEYLDTLEKEKYYFSDTRNRSNSSQSVKTKKLSAGILKTANVLCNPYLILETVSDLHIQLTDMCTYFNSAFSIQLLFRVFTSLLGIIVSIFYFIVDFQYQHQNNSNYQPIISGLMIFACAFCVIELYILARISDKTCQEANNCPLMLHNIKHSCTDPEILDAIELYSIQMFHNKLQFTVCGLFPIDHTLLYSMTGAVTTYLIFLVQFSKSSIFKEMMSGMYNTTI